MARPCPHRSRRSPPGGVLRRRDSFPELNHKDTKITKKRRIRAARNDEVDGFAADRSARAHFNSLHDSLRDLRVFVTFVFKPEPTSANRLPPPAPDRGRSARAPAPRGRC